jgi:hypothetical protein
MVKKKTIIKVNDDQEELEYRRKVSSISKRDLKTPKNTVLIQRTKSLR